MISRRSLHRGSAAEPAGCHAPDAGRVAREVGDGEEMRRGARRQRRRCPCQLDLRVLLRVAVDTVADHHGADVGEKHPHHERVPLLRSRGADHEGNQEDHLLVRLRADDRIGLPCREAERIILQPGEIDHRMLRRPGGLPGEPQPDRQHLLDVARIHHRDSDDSRVGRLRAVPRVRLARVVASAAISGWVRLRSWAWRRRGKRLAHSARSREKVATRWLIGGKRA